MGLQVWLPLTGNINNQGLSSISFSSTGISSATDGKLGSCYNNTSHTTGYLLSDKTIDLGTNQSMFCWVKFTSLESSAGLGGGLVSQHRYSNNTGMGLTIKYVSSTTGYLSVNTGNGSSRTWNTYCGKTLLSAGTWYHVGYTYDGSNIKLYVNGNLDLTQAYTGMSTPADYITAYCWSMSSSSGTSIYSDCHLDGKLNDIRVYDNCLSDEEIAEIAQGLVLHYKLDDVSIESTTNLSNQTSHGGWNNSGAATRTWGDTTVVGPTDQTVYSILVTTAGNCACTFGTTSSSLPSKTLTFSVYCYLGETQENRAIYIRSTKTDGNVGSFSYNGSTNPSNWPKKQWIRLVQTITTASDATTFYFCTYCDTLNVYRAFNGWQIEEKDHVTNYTPSTSSFTTVYDCSGLGNDGNRSGALTVTSNTPRYENSTTIPSGGYIGIVNSSTNTMKLPDAITISFWYYPISTDSSERYIIDCYESGGAGACWQNQKIKWQIYANSTYNALYSASTLTLNTWTHVGCTYDGRYLKVYLNGELSNTLDLGATYNITYQATTPWEIGGNPGAGAYGSGNLTGNLSDMRIYATCLNADDIRNLYRNNIIVNNMEKVHSFEFIEE